MGDGVCGVKMVKRKSKSTKRNSTKRKLAKKSDKYSLVKPKRVKICMKCGSTDVNIVPGNIHLSGVSGSAPRVMYQCATCGRRDEVFPEVDESGIEHFRENLLKVPYEQRMPGHGGFRKTPRLAFLLFSIFLIIVSLVLIYLEMNKDSGVFSMVLAIIILLIGCVSGYIGIFYKK